MTVPALLLQLRHTVGRCPYCRDDAVGELLFCEACAAPHHTLCWRDMGRCATCLHDRAHSDPVSTWDALLECYVQGDVVQALSVADALLARGDLDPRLRDRALLIQRRARGQVAAACPRQASADTRPARQIAKQRSLSQLLFALVIGVVLYTACVLGAGSLFIFAKRSALTSAQAQVVPHGAENHAAAIRRMNEWLEQRNALRVENRRRSEREFEQFLHQLLEPLSESARVAFLRRTDGRLAEAGLDRGRLMASLQHDCSYGCRTLATRLAPDDGAR